MTKRQETFLVEVTVTATDQALVTRETLKQSIIADLSELHLEVPLTSDP